MSKRDESEDEKNREEKREVVIEQWTPTSEPRRPPGGYRGYRNEPDRLSALSFITCSSCKTVYLKGDQHECA
jgi:hypothetical protein